MTEKISLNLNEGDIREALPGVGALSLSALEPLKGEKSCFHISLDYFKLIWDCYSKNWSQSDTRQQNTSMPKQGCWIITLLISKKNTGLSEEMLTPIFRIFNSICHQLLCSNKVRDMLSLWSSLNATLSPPAPPTSTPWLTSKSMQFNGRAFHLTKPTTTKPQRRPSPNVVNRDLSPKNPTIFVFGNGHGWSSKCCFKTIKKEKTLTSPTPSSLGSGTTSTKLRATTSTNNHRSNNFKWFVQATTDLPQSWNAAQIDLSSIFPDFSTATVTVDFSVLHWTDNANKLIRQFGIRRRPNITKSAKIIYNILDAHFSTFPGSLIRHRQISILWVIQDLTKMANWGPQKGAQKDISKIKFFKLQLHTWTSADTLITCSPLWLDITKTKAKSLGYKWKLKACM